MSRGRRIQRYDNQPSLWDVGIALARISLGCEVVDCANPAKRHVAKGKKVVRLLCDEHFVCDLPNCSRAMSCVTSGYCDIHHQSFRKYGDPEHVWVSPLQLFIQALIDHPTDECVRWPFGYSRGYGILDVDGRKVLAHRYAFYLLYGWWPTVGRHRCKPKGNSWCVNPYHIKDGTAKDNVADKVEDGMTPWGEWHPLAKLTAVQVQAIRVDSNNGVSDQELGARYGVSKGTVADIRRGTTWKLLPLPNDLPPPRERICQLDGCDEVISPDKRSSKYCSPEHRYEEVLRRQAQRQAQRKAAARPPESKLFSEA